MCQKATCHKMHAAIKASGLSQREICRRMGIYPDRLCHLLKGRRHVWTEKFCRSRMNRPGTNVLGSGIN